MLVMLALSVQLMSGQLEVPTEKPAEAKLLPVWVPAASGGVTQTIAFVVFAALDTRACSRRELCPFGLAFRFEMLGSAILIHSVVAISTVVLAIINAVRVGEAKKTNAVTFDGVALHF